MSGYIRKRGKRSWTVQVELPPDSATGERRRRTFSVHGNRKEAQQALTRALYERDHGVDVSPDRMTVAALLNRWLRDYAEPSVAPSTFAKYGQQARRVAAMIGSVGLRDLRPAHVQTVHARLREQGLSAQSVVHHHRVLRSALAWAMRMQLVATNPADSVKPPRVERHEMRFLDEADVARLLSTCEDDEQRRLIFVALQTGLRIGELMALRWSDVDFEAGRASVSRSLQYLHRSLQFRPTKTARGRRSISISSATVTVLRQQRGVQLERRLRAGSAYDDHDLIWGDELGRPKSPPAVSTRFMRMARRSGFDGLRFHDLRHTSATLALKAGIPAKVVSERLGHSKVAFTLDTYAHVLPDMEQAAAEAMDSMIPSPEAIGL